MRGTEDAAVLIPVKAFREAKVRLTPALAPLDRARLARRMATTVVRAALGLPVAVVCDDDEVAAWAAEVGAEVLWRPGLGLNGAVTDGVATLAGRGLRRVLVAHADLPHATDLRRLLVGPAPDPERAGVVTLVPDRRRDGTNVIVLPAACGFGFAYGPGSFDRHRAEAARLGLEVVVVDDRELAWDVDVPADLARPSWAAS
jgi:2-phospho-L-lactate guanylyltransferase